MAAVLTGLVSNAEMVGSAAFVFQLSQQIMYTQNTERAWFRYVCINGLRVV